jgi:hypothetical protein
LHNTPGRTKKKKETVTHPKESITILRKPVHNLSTLSIQPIDQEPVKKEGCNSLDFKKGSKRVADLIS